MQSNRESGLGDLEAQLASKERKWKELLAARIHQLESFLKTAHDECSSLRERYQQLREDFQFNLTILDERDRELERYDVITARALSVKHNRQEELNHLHIQVAKLEEQRAREAEERQEELSKSQHNTAQHRLQLHELRHSMAGEIQKQTKEYERMKWDLQCRIHELEEELTLQKQEMTAAFDSELRQREHEFNLKMDEMHAAVLSHELKMRLLSKEIEFHCQVTEALKASKKFCHELQTQLQHKEQEIKDLTAVKDYKIKELEDKLKWMETKLKEEEDNHIKKYEDVIRALKECDVQLEVQCLAHAQQLQKAEEHIVKLKENIDVLAAHSHCIQKDQQEAMEQKDETIQRLRTEVETTRTGWDKYITQVSSEMVVKDTEIITLQERETKHKTEWDRNRKEMKGYKRQLSTGLKRQKVLEQMHVEVELEWQRRCENMKAEHYLVYEQLIQDLTQARDQAKAQLKEKEQELQDLTVLLHSVNTERDQAIQGLTPTVDSMALEEIRHLQVQNSILRAVVTQMRKDMEGLSHLLPHPQVKTQAFSPQQVQHQGAPGQMATGPPAQSTDIPSSVSPAGGLKKHPNISALMKQEVRVAHITEQSAQLQEENPYLQEQQTSCLMLGGLFESVQGAKSNPPLLHTRLRQAAFCIARLSKEKQQLIEMGNRLRGQITTGLKGCFPEKDSTEKQGDQHDRLSALEKLQHQLTTQELQYVVRQRACTFAEQLFPGTNNQGLTTKGAANPWPQGHKTTDNPETSKSKENTCPLGQSQSSLDVGPQPHSGLSRSQLSSEESLRPLKELWEILDHGLSPSIFSEGEGEVSRRDVATSGGAGVQMMVHGVSAPIHSQPPTKVQQRRSPSTTPSNTIKTSRPGAYNRISKIRNYNVKD